MTTGPAVISTPLLLVSSLAAALTSWAGSTEAGRGLGLGLGGLVWLYGVREESGTECSPRFCWRPPLWS